MQLTDCVVGNKYIFTIVDGISNVLGKSVTGEYIGHGTIKAVPNRQFVTSQYQDFKTTYNIGSSVTDEDFFMFDVSGETFAFARSWVTDDSVSSIDDVTLEIKFLDMDADKRSVLIRAINELGLKYELINS